MSRSVASSLVLAASGATILVSCIQSTGNPGPSGNGTNQPLVERQGECTAPRLILAGPSPFEEALALWRKDRVGSRRALDALEKACDGATDGPVRGTEHAACAMLGLIYSSGEGVPRDADKAFSFLERGAQCGFSFGAHDLAQAVGHGIEGKSVGCCGGRGCEPGCEEECSRASASVRDAIVPPLQGACAEGRGVGCFMLSALTNDGEYIQRVGRVVASSSRFDHAALVDRACKAGVGPACMQRSYGFTESEPATARALLERSCDLGWGDACLSLGEQKDREGHRPLAVPYWEKACKLRLRSVCSELATILSEGKGVPVDHERAAGVESNAWR